MGTRASLLLVVLVACGDGGSATPTSGSSESSGPSTTAEAEGSTSDASGTTVVDDSESGGVPLSVDAGESRYALVGESVVLDGSASMGAVGYQWFLDDGSQLPEPGPVPIAMAVYGAPGRCRPVLTVFGPGGESLADEITITVTEPPSHAPRQSGSIALEPGGDRIAVVSPDSDEIAIAVRTDDTFAIVGHLAVCDDPRTLSWLDGRIAVACADGGVVQLVDPETGDGDELELPRASRPFGVLAVEGELFVTLQATGELARLTTDDGLALAERRAVVPDARGLALLPDGRLAVSRWRSTDDIAELALVDRKGGAPAITTLRFDPKEATDTEAGGIPSYLDQILVSPQGDRIAVPSLQANIGQGAYLDGDALIFDETLRGVVSWIDWPAAEEDFEARKHLDNRGFMAAAVWSSRGDYLFVADRGSRSIERVDTFNGAQAGALLDVGLAPQGLALSADDRFLFIDAYMSRELAIYDVRDFEALPQAVARLPIASAEPLAPELLRGKQLFNDAYDPRLARDGYIACAHCHLDGQTDRRTWDFTDRGEGMRNTASLLGHAGTGHGPVHWSANFDEIQDFEQDIRNAFGGAGLMSDRELATGTRAQSLGDSKAGISPDLDALAAYVTALDVVLPSPHREPDGALGADALAGAALFDELGCASCHIGTSFTDSELVTPTEPRLHDVGTITAASGQRLGGPLEGLDTPTLLELWNGPPYLHDGSAPALQDVLVARNPADEHGVTSTLTAAEIDRLVAFLLALE